MTPRRGRPRAALQALALLVLAGCTGGMGAFPENPPPAYFRVEWALGRSRGGAPVIESSVFNESGQVGTRILLLIETVDASGSRTSAMVVPVPGDLSPGSHRYFTTQVPSATERYRVSVYAVDRRIGGP